jgi:hypothetical protein
LKKRGPPGARARPLTASWVLTEKACEIAEETRELQGEFSKRAGWSVRLFRNAINPQPSQPVHKIATIRPSSISFGAKPT